MKHAFKKIMALLLAVVMVIGILPAAFAANVEPFTDVQDSDWFAPYVKYVYEHKPVLMNGTTKTTFEPNGTLTRAMAAVVLYRLADPVIPSVRPSTFTDLEDDWYKNGVAWAQQTGIVNGISESKFNPNGLVSREQLVAMMWRYNEKPEVEEDYLADFADAAKVSDYAKAAFNWAVSKTIIGGMKDKSGKLILNPQGNATRAEFAKIISVFNEVTRECEGNHSWNEGEQVKAATCTEDGEIIYTCVRCGETKTEIIPALGHSYVDGVCGNCGEKLADKGDIVIYYTNDVHTYIDGALSYDNIADLKAQTSKVADGVLLVDAGDHIQGTAYGSMDKGQHIIELMNAAKYDLATLGNHEFDYGMARALEITEIADFDYVSANFYNEKNGVKGEPVLDPFQILTAGGKKIAMIGITTPETFTKSTPAYFQDEAGNYIYGIAGGDDGAALYADVQAAINAAKAVGADYIIALGHLGDDPASKPWTSEELIANVSGLDAFIDGHSHSTVEGKEVADKDGNKVLLTQTGEYFDAIGKMTINAEGITTELITAYNGSDATVAGIKNEWINEIETKLGEVIGYAEVTLDNYVDGNRIVRKQETNTGDFAADALYYLFDVTEGLEVDLAIMNGGGVRNKAVTGELSYLSCKEIHTFGNVACLQTVTGQQILDALEWGARDAGAAECGGFLHVSGVTYEIHTYIPSTVQKDDKGVWTGAPTGEYRVKNVKIGGEDLDLNATYNMAGYNYTLRDLGDGFAMFDGAVNVKDYVMEDYMVLANYIKSFAKDASHNNLPTIKADSIYAEVTGEGRIVMVNEDPNAGKGDAFGLASSIKDGDEVVIYNAASGMAFSSNMSGYNVAGEAVTPVENVISTSNTSIIWKVKANADGTYTFEQGDGAMGFTPSGTFFNITFTGADATTFKIKSCNAAKNSYFIYNATLQGQYGNVYLEWYDAKSAFSAYCTSDDRVKEGAFDFQFYVKGKTPDQGGSNPGGDVTGDQTFVKVTADQADWSGKYVIGWDDGSNAVIFNGETDSEGNVINTTISGGKVTAPASAIIIIEKVDGGYTFKATAGYLNGKTEKNGISFESAPAVGDVTWKGSNPVITAKTGYVLRYNNGLQYGSTTEYSSWFRFYKTTSSVKTEVNLYKLSDGSNPGGGNDPVDPPTPPAPSGDDFVLSTEIKAGDEVIIVCAAKNMALAADYPNGSFYNAGVAVTPVDGKISNPDATIVWTVGEDGEFYTFANNGQKIGMGTEYTSMTLGAVNYKWQVSEAATEGAFYIANLDRDPAKAYYMQWYESKGYWSGYHTITEEFFAMNFYVKGAEGSETPDEPIVPDLPDVPDEPDTPVDPDLPDLPDDPVVDEEAFVLTTEIKEGDEVIIVCAAKNMALAADYPNGSFYNAGVAVEPVDGKITDPDATIVWTVGEDGEFYTFSFDGEKIGMGTEYTSMTLGAVNYKWQVSEAATEGAFYIANLDRDPAKAYYMQWYESKGYWSGYHTITEEFFAMNFYVKGAEVEEVCNHSWGRGNVTVEPTCTEDGEMTFTCAFCGETKTEIIAANGHDYVDGVCECGAKEPVAGAYTIATSLKVGDQIIITVNNNGAHYAMAADGATVKNALNAVAVTVNGSAMDIGSAEKVIWTVCAGSVDGKYTLKSEDGQYISYSGSGTSLTLGDTGADYELICGEGTSKIAYGADSKGTVRSIFFRDNAGVPQFRCYGDSNATASTYCAVLTIWKVG